ncbi:unnamed protein product [Cunninghamella blakesleeana]
MASSVNNNANNHDNHDNQENYNDNEPMTKEKEEYLNSAAIAKLLAEDQLEAAYQGKYTSNSKDNGGDDNRGDESYEDESEDDYDPNQKKKPKKKKTKKNEVEKKVGAKRGRKRKIIEPEVSNYDIDYNDYNQTSTSSSNYNKTKKKSSESEESTGNEPTTTISEDNAPPSSAGSKSKAEKSKKPKKPLPPGMNGGIYTDDEEKLFLEGLNLYGRDWQSLAKHMGTRESHSVRSHAQKHFIKLYRDNLPLPDKVKESGEGFTLSGKPLDPNSAAAKPYLSRAGLTTTESITEKVENIKIASSDPDESSSNGINGEPTSSSAVPIIKPNKSENTQPKTKKLKVSNKQKPSKIKAEKKLPQPSDISYEENGRTKYATSRLRSQPKSNHTYEVDAPNSEHLTLVECVPFDTVDKGFGAILQPFSLHIHTNVSLVMDFHAHLKSTEIIGLLAGNLDLAKKRIVVKEAYPCKSLNTGQNEVNVEMDEFSAFEARQDIEQKDMKVVGWYHSHPVFLPDPSFVDITNQYNYQKLSTDTFTVESETSETTPSCSTSAVSTDNKNNNSNNDNDDNDNDKKNDGNNNGDQLSPGAKFILEPFVGAIVTPYDPDMETPISAINWFYVTDDIHANSKTARSLSYEIIESKCLSTAEETRMLKLLDDYKTSSEKTDFKEIWRSASTENKLTKLIRTLASRMPWLLKQLMNKVKNTENTNTPVDPKGKGKAEAMETADQQATDIDTIMEDGQDLQRMDTDEDKKINTTGDNSITDNIIIHDQFLQTVKSLLEDW